MRWPLRYQILVPTGAVMLGTLVGVSVLNAYLSARKAKTQIHGQLRDVADTLSHASFPLTDAVLQQTRGLSGAEFVVTDRSGQVMSSSRSGLVPPPLSQSDSKLPQSDRAGRRVAQENPGWSDTEPPMAADEPLGLGEIVRVGNERYFHAVVGLSRPTNVDNSAVLHIFYPEDSYRAALWNAVLPPLLVGGVALVLVVLLATIIAARVTRPLGQLRSQVDRIARGEFQPIPLPRRNDEILDLGQSVNRMAEMLAGYEDEVRRNERLRTLGQLSGGMAHQLRNAATGCRMALQLHRRACSVEDGNDTLSVALRQLALMERYLEHFFSRQNGPAKPHVPVNLVSVTDDVLVLVRPNAEHVGIRLELVPPEKPVFVDGDSDDLRQLVLNLVVNAVDAAATPRETGNSFQDVGSIAVQVKPVKGDRVLLEVRDSGPGPVDEVSEAMFEPLVTGKTDGTGLGLFVAREIAKQHKGEIRWERRDGTTRFIVELPRSNLEREYVETTGC